jgi:hypothetical protein
MKKRLILTLALTLSLSSLVACGDNKVANKTESKVESTSETNKLLTERTIDIGSNKPWEAAAQSKIKEWRDKGETIFLWSDANELENMVLKSIEIKDHREERIPGISEFVQLFIDEVKKQKPDQKEYFDKMSKAVNDMKAVNLDGAKTKIEEAKKLREAK